MAKLLFVMVDENEKYLEKVSFFLTREFGHRFSVEVYTSIDRFKEKYPHPEDVSMVFVDASVLDDGLISKGYNVGVLHSGHLPEEYKSYGNVNKFLPGDALGAAMMNCFIDSKPDVVVAATGKKNSTIIATFSPIGGIGKTTITAALGREIAKRDKSVLYLSLEEFPSYEIFFDNTAENSVTELFYFASERSTNLGLKVDMNKKKDDLTGIHYFAPPKSYLDVNAMTVEDVDFLIDSIEGAKIFDYILLDISPKMDEKTLQLLEKSDKVILLGGYRPNEIIKIQRFVEDLDRLEKRNNLKVRDKIHFVVNKLKDVKTIDFETINPNSDRQILNIPYINNLLYIENQRLLLKDESSFVEPLSKLYEGIR